MIPLTKLKKAKATVAVTGKPLSPPNMKNLEVYQQRKCMLTEYRELFTALMKLPDKEMQKKIFNVINHHKSVEYRSAETQTDPIEIREFKKEHIEQDTYIIEEIVTTESFNTNTGATINESNTNTEESLKDVVASKKRKRKRKISLPHANKESRVAKQVVKSNKPTPPSRSLKHSHHPPSKSNDIPSKRLRVDSFNPDSLSSDVFDLFAGIDDSRNSNLQLKLLVKDILLSDIEFEDGLLPIHDTIIKNDDYNLTKQIYIWKDFKKIDLNELLTNDDQDLLQLAIVNSPSPSIIKLLLNAGLNPDCLDGESNTVLHLAILNDIEVLALEHLMQRIDLKLIITLNDDGYNPLHLAVRHDRFLLAERLINILDKRLMGKSFYEREIDNFETDENVLKTQFKDFYEKICLQMEVEDENICINNHDLKQRLLQSGDRRSGNTPLYFAIENKSDHLIHFLLAHLTDPRTENLSGLDCKTFFSEYGKSLNLTLNIDNVMEKVIKILS